MTLFPDLPKTHKAAKKRFGDRVVELVMAIPPGRVSTYGAIARKAGGGGMAAQSITSILSKAAAAGKKNIPYHRIVYSDGRIWVTESGRKKRMALYKKEGIMVDAKDRITNFGDICMYLD